MLLVPRYKTAILPDLMLLILLYTHVCGDYRACVDVCGDGITSGAEACDDANTQDADGNHASHCLTTTMSVSSYY
jgi:cysteine-rich repeat protein